MIHQYDMTGLTDDLRTYLLLLIPCIHIEYVLYSVHGGDISMAFFFFFSFSFLFLFPVAVQGPRP